MILPVVLISLGEDGAVVSFYLRVSLTLLMCLFSIEFRFHLYVCLLLSFSLTQRLCKYNIDLAFSVHPQSLFFFLGMPSLYQSSIMFKDVHNKSLIYFVVAKH